MTLAELFRKLADYRSPKSKQETTTTVTSLATKMPKPMGMIKNTREKSKKDLVQESTTTYSYYQARGTPMGYSVEQRMMNTTATALGYKLPETLDPSTLQEGDKVIVLTRKGEPISQGYIESVGEYDVVVRNFDQQNSYSKEAHCFRRM
jgi:hypothetical protein